MSISRREFLKVAGLGGASLGLTACAPKIAEAVMESTQESTPTRSEPTPTPTKETNPLLGELNEVDRELLEYLEISRGRVVELESVTGGLVERADIKRQGIVTDFEDFLVEEVAIGRPVLPSDYWGIFGVDGSEVEFVAVPQVILEGDLNGQMGFPEQLWVKGDKGWKQLEKIIETSDDVQMAVWLDGGVPVFWYSLPEAWDGGVRVALSDGLDENWGNRMLFCKEPIGRSFKTMLSLVPLKESLSYQLGLMPDVFVEIPSGVAAELSIAEMIRLNRMGIEPILVNGTYGVLEGNVFRTAVPEGSVGVLAESPGVMELNDGRRLVFEFTVPDGVKVVMGKDKDGRWVVVPMKDEDMVGKPRPVDYEAGTEVVVYHDAANTAWFAVNEGEVRRDTTNMHVTDAQNLLLSPDLERNSEKRQEYLGKLNKVYGQNFGSWEGMMDYIRPKFVGREFNNWKYKVPGDGSGSITEAWDVVPGKPEMFPNKGRHFFALGLGWEKVYNQELGVELVKVDFINPSLSNELMSMYVGYVKNGEVKDFLGVIDFRTDDDDTYSYYRKSATSYTDLLDDLTVGKQTANFGLSAWSTVGVEGVEPETIFTEYAQAESKKKNWGEVFVPGPLAKLVTKTDAGLYYRALSDSGLSEVVFLPGLLPDELVKIAKGLGTDTFVGMNFSMYPGNTLEK